MKKFRKVYIEITNVCNLSCYFCPKTQREQKFMGLNEFEHIIEKIKDITSQVYLHVLGEPLLHPFLREILDICDRNSLKVNITTNGILINKKSDLIISSKAIKQINISLHSFDNKNGTIAMDQYIESILHFSTQIQQKSSATVKLRLWNLDDSYHSNQQNVKILDKLHDFYNLDFQIENELTELKGIKLSRQVFLSLANKFEWPGLTENEYDGEAFCYGLRDQIAILVDGTVVPCCLDAQGIMAIGNIFNEEIDEIINSTRAIKIYEGFSKRCAIEELCRKCEYRTRFTKK